DLVAITDADTRHGPSYRAGQVTIGVIIHSDSTVSGHGPGVTALLNGPARFLQPLHRSRANLAEILGVRRAAPPQRQATLMERDRRRARIVREPPPRLAFETRSGGGELAPK